MSKQPKRPYLLRALYDWIVDSDLTPYVLVNAEAANVSVPSDYVNEGKIILNVAPNAVRGLTMDSAALVCECRFGGEPVAVYVPMVSIEAIYAKETGEGMAFETEIFPPPPDDDGPDDSGPKPPGSHLKVVK